ncbi:hypothetical protein TTHERM_00215890 (macronuclear) [Tetrahymena thermophila SB210]|uniref:Uncharacterized protein n=1 Tax=Tetrahymena thermophila (strain SB210) TaxID=312017 RepID=I7MKS3_TETTS|nr:hypothetical protein TTHERM_00215890 [Tetrahymena thermophila SB210]EAS00214.2 hypothetical protein TTHERM_00215890 [Tetrahymena thermophila SB210]|eukprot:XP_001020459.2 hypothetical protein TTHERM_00215890 [Tetrahymena thermophila SB210]
MSQQQSSEQFSSPQSGSTIESKQKHKTKIRSISTNKQYNKADQQPLKLDKIDFKKRENSFVLDCQKFSAKETLTYDPLLDDNLRLFFYNPRNKQSLIKNGLIKRDGSPVDSKMYRQFLNQTTINRTNSIETFYEREVIKKHKDQKLPPIIKIEQISPRQNSNDKEKEENLSTKQLTQRKVQKPTQIQLDKQENSFSNNFLTPQTKYNAGRKSPFAKSQSRRRIQKISSVEKERTDKKEKIIHTYGYTLQELKEDRQNTKELKKNQVNSYYEKNRNSESPNKDKPVKKEDFDIFIQTFRQKYSNKKLTDQQ